MSGNLHLVAAREPTPACTVPDRVTVVPHLGGKFLVQLTRHNGTSVAGVFMTREQIQELVVAASEALNPP